MRPGQDDSVEQLVRHRVGARAVVESGPIWLRVMPGGPALPEHGWKLHVSGRAAEFPALVEAVLPTLVEEHCAFKLARSQEVLAGLNDGLSSPATVGKAITIYPDQRRVRDLGLRLAHVLRGRKGPRILSDRQVRDDAPVYYRYGPFRGAGWEADAHGRLVSPLRGPAGEEFDGVATLAYRQPSWVTDPFTGQLGGHEAGAGEPVLLGGRYRVTDGVYQSARGNVYAAVDEQTGGVVIVKQARALVAEQGEHNDTRLRLRNERRVLQALDQVPGVPRFLDHFRHADDEFLVTSNCGPQTLIEDVMTGGRYLPSAPGAGGGDAGRRALERLAARLARILAGVHDRGVIMRDLSPKNVVTDGDAISIVDFGLAAYEDLHLPGGTAGYCPPRQFRGEPPHVIDDYFALGMTLLYAATTLDPVPAGRDPELPRRRALQTIRARYAERPTGVVGVIASLIGEDADRAEAAFGWLTAAREPGASTESRPPPAASRPAVSRPLPAAPPVTLHIAAEVAGHLRDDLLDQAADLMRGMPGSQAAHDGNIYSGTAGIGLELLHHMKHERTMAIVTGLVPFTARAATRVNLPPGLFVGVTGVDVFLRQAAGHGIEASEWPAGGRFPDANWAPVNDDLIVGTAGVGLGHLALFHSTGDATHLDVARRCAGLLGDRSADAGAAGAASAHAGSVAAGPPADLSSGSAHGLAGVTGFLLSYAAQTGAEPDHALAAGHAGRLAQRARVLLTQARNPAAPALAVSWCRGLTGIGRTLLQAGCVLGDTTFTALAREAADVCCGYVPRLSVLGRCCGVAGIGSFLIDLALATQDDRYWRAADDVAAHMLLRSWGDHGHPLFVDDSPHGSNASSWAFGLTGLLSFFRRLADRGGPDSLPLYTP